MKQLGNGLLEFTQLEKGFFLYFGLAIKRFLLDSDSKPTQIELNGLKLHQPGCSGYIECILDHLDPDVTVFFTRDFIAMISDASYDSCGKWFFKNYHQIETFY